jgi:outer membrane receptor protein involved in Fe transport
VRNPVTGGLTGATIAGGGYIVQTSVNVAAAVVSGIDLQFDYKLDLGRGGSLDFDMNGTYLEHMQSQPTPGAHTYDCAGYFGFTCQTINPRWHHIFRTTWTTPLSGLSAATTWRYIGPVSEDNNSPDPTLHFATWGAYDFYNARIPSYSYLDLEATWQPTKILTLRAGINNVFDKDPPLIDVDLVGGGAANTYPIYDMFGRQLFIAFTARF